MTNSAGKTGAPAIFAQPAKWMDYSGPVPAADGAEAIEGITYFDHPTNPGQPTRWHVREDGWMGASPCMNQPQITTRKEPLVVRYLLHAHRGAVDPVRADKLAAEFADRPRFRVEQSTAKHRQYELQRVSTAS